MSKKNCALLLLCICLLPITGCWNRRELNELGIVLAVALDKDVNSGEIILTAQVVRPETQKPDGGGSKSEPVEMVTVRGITVFDAIRRSAKEFDRRLFFAHNRILVIDEQLARDGLLPILDFWRRSTETRPDIWLFLAKGATAREMIGQIHGIEGIPANYLDAIIKRRNLHSEATAVSLLDFVKALASDTGHPVMGTLELFDTDKVSTVEKKSASAKAINLTGTAVFNKDKLVGFLSAEETRGLNWITNEFKSGLVHVRAPDDEQHWIVIEVKKTATKIVPQIKNGHFLFRIEVTESGDILEQQSLSPIYKLPVLDEINQRQQDAIAADVHRTLDKVQNEFGLDILGFGRALQAKYPSEWENARDHWDGLFATADYELAITTRVRKTGALQRPLIDKKAAKPEVESRNSPYEMLQSENE